MSAPAALLSLVSLVSLLANAVAQAPAPATSPTPATPPHVEWQRSLADALAVQKATGLPLLIAVNMDGEPFCDRFAADTYKDPKFIEWTRGYVCVVASPDHHTERDHDALGRRVECPRFPGCTCSEHIAIEPGLFERFFSGTRNAPRHVAVDKNGKILFDRFLDASMQTAIDAIAKHRGTAKADPALPTAVDALLARRDAAARRALEQRFLAADAAGRRALLGAAPKATTEPFDLLRMGLHDLDDATFTLAAAALAKIASKDALPELEDALARADDDAVRNALIERLAELGRDDATLARLAAHLAPASAGPKLSPPWSGSWRQAAFAADDRVSIETELDRAEGAVRATPNDAGARLALAIAQAAFADVLIQERGSNIEFWFADSRRNAELVHHTAMQNEAQALIAYIAYMTDDADGAARATVAAQAAAPNAREPDPWVASRLLDMAMLTTVNGVYADPAASKQRVLRAEIDKVDAALDLLLQRGGAKEAPCLAGIGMLEFAGRRRDARQKLQRLAALFPASATVHERWRNRLLEDLGPEMTCHHYAAHVAAAADKPVAEWFAGYAAMVAGERHTRDRRSDAARAAYDEAVDRFTRSAAGNEDFADSANHFAVLALAGRAHLRFAAGDAAGAVDDLVRAAALRPESLDETDGLLRKPRAIAGRIARDLGEQGQQELAARLQPLLP